MRFAIIVLSGLLSACATTPPAVVTTEAGGRSHLVFLRTRDSRLYILRDAPVYVDGQKADSIAYGGAFRWDVDPGTHRLAVKTWDSPGQCEVVIEAEADRSHYFQVDPRTESFTAFMAGDVAGLAVSSNTWVALASGLALASAESYAQECGGLFRVYPLDESTARTRLAELGPHAEDAGTSPGP
jgi:hypothetical protein